MEMEVAAAFYNAIDGLNFHTTLKDLSHPQPLLL